MGAVRKFPRNKAAHILRDPCTPGSKHRWEEVQRNPNRAKIEGDYIVLHRCLHCANSVYIQTKRYSAALKKPPTKKDREVWANLTNGVL